MTRFRSGIMGHLFSHHVFVRVKKNYRRVVAVQYLAIHGVAIIP